MKKQLIPEELIDLAQQAISYGRKFTLEWRDVSSDGCKPKYKPFITIK